MAFFGDLGKFFNVTTPEVANIATSFLLEAQALLLVAEFKLLQRLSPKANHGLPTYQDDQLESTVLKQSRRYRKQGKSQTHLPFRHQHKDLECHNKHL